MRGALKLKKNINNQIKSVIKRFMLKENEILGILFSLLHTHKEQNSNLFLYYMISHYVPDLCVYINICEFN